MSTNENLANQGSDGLKVTVKETPKVNPQKILDLTAAISYLDSKHPGFKADFENAARPAYTITSKKDWVTKYLNLNHFEEHIKMLIEAAYFAQAAYVKALSEIASIQSAVAITAESASMMESYRYKGQIEGISKTMIFFDQSNTATYLKNVLDYALSISYSYLDSKYKWHSGDKLE